MPKKRVTFKFPLVKKIKMKGGDKNKDMICVIHAKWCEHCKQLMLPKENSLWEEAKKKIGNKCEVKEYEETEHKDKIEELKERGVSVDGFPTIFKINKDGKIDYFKKDRTVDEIYKFAVGDETSGGQPIQMGGKRKRKTARLRKSSWFF